MCLNITRFLLGELGLEYQGAMNIALCTLPINFVAIYGIKVPLAMAMAKEGKGYDNHDPRGQQARLDGWGKRANAAHMNAFEAFPPFAIAVVLCVLTHANETWTTALAVTHTVARLVYPALYIANIAQLRSVVWLVGVLCTIGLLILPLTS
jgi:uncharacterized MAPEG superfamily protein